MKIGLSIASLILSTPLLASCGGNNNAYRLTVIDTCKRTPITIGEMEKQIKDAGYRGQLDESHKGDSLAAFNRAACGKEVITCKGEVMYWSQMDKILSDKKRVNYDGRLDHTQSELDAYNRAACAEKRQ